MQILIPIRERNAGAFNNIMSNGIPAKLTANLVATPLNDPTPPVKPKAEPQLTQAQLETKLKEHKALPEAEQIGKCHCAANIDAIPISKEPVRSSAR